MVKGHVGFKLDPVIREKIEELVEAGQYVSISEFLNQAIQYYFNKTEFSIETEARLIEYLRSDQGRALIREIMDQERKT